MDGSSIRFVLPHSPIPSPSISSTSSHVFCYAKWKSYKIQEYVVRKNVCNTQQYVLRRLPVSPRVRARVCVCLFLPSSVCAHTIREKNSIFHFEIDELRRHDAHKMKLQNIK